MAIVIVGARKLVSSRGQGQKMYGRRRQRFKKDAVTTQGDNAADRYAARVDAVLRQRTRLRGRQPPGDLFAGLPSDHPLMTADPRRPLDPNLEIIA